MDDKKEDKELERKSSKAIAAGMISQGALLLTFALAVCFSKGRILKSIFRR